MSMSSKSIFRALQSWMFPTGVWHHDLVLNMDMCLWLLSKALAFGLGFDFCSVESRKYVVSGGFGFGVGSGFGFG